MKMEIQDNHINYIEFKGNDLERVKAFYIAVFGWTFTDYGPDYTSFSDSGVAGGFERSEGKTVNGALVVLYHSNLEQIKESVVKHGGTITRDIFNFPGGRRFHFTDPADNELAIWSDK
jgi:predicted enzyme related to lactoylglutathione lyase